MAENNQMSEDTKLAVIAVSVVAVLVTIVGGFYLLYKANHPTETYKADASSSSEQAEAVEPPSDKNTNGCYTPETVRNHYGETDCVDFQVGYTFETSGGTKFIDEKVDYQNGFVVYIPRDSEFSTVALSQFDGKTVKVTGLINSYNGYPQIEATSYSQVKIYE